LFELADTMLCTEGLVTSLVGLSLTAEHHRGHGALYDAVNNGVVEVGRLRRAIIGLPLPRDRAARIVLAVEISVWLCPDAGTAEDCRRSRNPDCPSVWSVMSTKRDNPGSVDDLVVRPRESTAHDRRGDEAQRPRRML
jgi:hypothetical protein